MLSALAKVWAAAMLAVLVAPPASPAPFTRHLPKGVPDGAGWLRIAGNIEVDSPPVAVQYEFFVNPVRPALYEVVRYRVTQKDPLRTDGRYDAAERLQWHHEARDMRRWQCVADPAPGASCRWNEVAHGSTDYIREARVLLWLYGLHQRAEDERLAVR